MCPQLPRAQYWCERRAGKCNLASLQRAALTYRQMQEARALKRTLVLSPLFRSYSISDAGTEIHCNGCTLHYFNQPALWLQLHLVHRLHGKLPVRSTELPWCDYRDGLPHWRLRAQGHQQRSTTLREEEPWNFIPHPDPDWGVVASSSGKYLSVQQNRYHFCAPGIFWTQWSENIHSL